MKIDSTYKPATTSLPTKANSPQPAASPVQEAVSLSQVAGSLHAGDSPPINSARIQEIKQAISEGRFKINPEAIAERLIDSARELVNSNAGKRQA